MQLTARVTALLVCLAGCAAPAPQAPAPRATTAAGSNAAEQAPDRDTQTTTHRPADAGRSAKQPYGPSDTEQNVLAPWSVRETRLADNHWLVSLRKALFSVGGDGEAGALLHLHAQRLAQQQGYSAYEILSFTEGVQSDMPLPYRWARGEIVLKGALPAMPDS